ncbi:MAG: integration host factor subunit beta [Burkholderiaceae bacterium]
MTKSELINRLAQRFEKLPFRDTDFAVKMIIDTMVKSLADGVRIEIRGFGSFSLTHRPARLGRNPKSGEQVHVPEKRVPHFKPGKELRERVDQASRQQSRHAAQADSVAFVFPADQGAA